MLCTKNVMSTFLSKDHGSFQSCLVSLFCNVLIAGQIHIFWNALVHTCMNRDMQASAHFRLWVFLSHFYTGTDPAALKGKVKTEEHMFLMIC